MLERETILVRIVAAPDVTVEAYPHNELAVHRAVRSPQFWTVTHKASGWGVTADLRFDSRAQAGRYADELQRHIDFRGVGDPLHLVTKIGQATINRAIGAAKMAAFGA